MKQATNTPERDSAQAPLDRRTIQWWRIVLAARRAGASVRTLAKVCGCGKSTMARLLPQLELLSQMGQLGPRSTAETGLSVDDLSQMGQLPVMEAAE